MTLMRVKVFTFPLWGTWWVVRSGRRTSIALSALSTVFIGFFFMHLHGWSPPRGQELFYAHLFDLVMLSVFVIQVVTLAATSTSGARAEVELDTVMTIIPAALMAIVLVLHYGHFVVLSGEQTWYAIFTALVMWGDLLTDLGVILLAQSRLPIGGR